MHRRNSIPKITKMDILTKLPIISYPRRCSLQLANQFSEKKYLHSPRDSFHRAIYPVLFVAQIFGLFPVQGISTKNASHLKFKWISFRTLYSILFIFYCIFITFAEIYRMHVNNADDTSAKSLAGLIFFIVTTCASMILFYISTKWREIMIFWEKNESVFQRKPYSTSNTLKKKICLAGALMLIGSTLEHALAKASAFYAYDYEAHYCNKTFAGTLHYYANRDFYSVFILILPFYHDIIVIFCYIGLVMQTFAWTFLDFFIIAISLGISERFRQFNEHLNEMYKTGSPQLANQQYWKTARYHFGLICEILEYVDRLECNNMMGTIITYEIVLMQFGQQKANPYKILCY
uniref:CSON012659 protein n=1 Tax=Culicoides sonorensis TaxID=179676 RepID=A0A336M5Z9_CULSO